MTIATGQPILASDFLAVKDSVDKNVGDVARNSHNILQLYIQQYLAGNSVDYNGLFFDGFSDTTKTDVANTGAKVDTANKRVKFGTLGSNPEFDAVSQGEVVADTSLTYSHTVATDATLIVVTVNRENSATGATTVTYGGESLTEVSGGKDEARIFYLANPTAGANNVVITCATSTNIASTAVSYTSADTVSIVGASASNNGISSSSSVSITTGTNNSIVVDTVTHKSSGATLTHDSGQTQRGSAIPASGFRCGFSEKVMATAGATTMGWTHGTSNDWWITAVEIKKGEPATTAVWQSIKTTFQQKMALMTLWVTRDITVRYNHDSTPSGAVVKLAGDKTGEFAVSDTVDVYNTTNTTRERRTISAIDYNTTTTGKTTITLSSALTGTYSTSDYIERVDVLPNASIVAEGGTASFASLTYVQSDYDSANTKVQDKYTYEPASAGNDVVSKLLLSRNDITLEPYAEVLLETLTAN